MKNRTLFAGGLTLAGIAGGNTYLIRKDTDGLHLDAWIDSPLPGAGPPTMPLLLSAFPGVSISAVAMNNAATLDFSNGDAFPATVSVPGGSGAGNSLTIEGLSGLPVAADGSTVTVWRTVITYSAP